MRNLFNRHPLGVDTVILVLELLQPKDVAVEFSSIAKLFKTTTLVISFLIVVMPSLSVRIT